MAGKLEDVAAVSGVSRSTVSRVLNGGSVSEETRQRVDTPGGRHPGQGNGEPDPAGRQVGGIEEPQQEVPGSVSRSCNRYFPTSSFWENRSSPMFFQVPRAEAQAFVDPLSPLQEINILSDLILFQQSLQ